MNIRTLWGFEGNAQLLGTTDSRIPAGQSFTDVDDEYAHQLIGKGLAEEVAGEEGKTAAKSTKQTKPQENK